MEMTWKVAEANGSCSGKGLARVERGISLRMMRMERGED
jgi:hypothetical protein